jgi:8-oxo-dGTP pyrophosphatase MutT (NUDIX family)
MPIYGMRRRVACYVTRTTEAGEELLVFEHTDDDPADPSGIQIPAGGMLPFEGIEEAAVREVNEETGLEDLSYAGQLGGVELGLDDPGGPSMTTYVHLTAAADGPTAWQHAVSGDGEDAGMTFACRWEPLPLAIELAGGQDAFLDDALA